MENGGFLLTALIWRLGRQGLIVMILVICSLTASSIAEPYSWSPTPNYEPVKTFRVLEDFSSLNESAWVPTSVNLPNFSYQSGPWFSDDNWLHSVIGGSDGPLSQFTGWDFTFTLPTNYTRFRVETEIGWEEELNEDVLITLFRLLSASGSVAGEWGFYDDCYNDTQRYLRTAYGGAAWMWPHMGLWMTWKLMLDGTPDHMTVYWNGRQLMSGSFQTPVAKIQLHIVGNSSYPGSIGGFNYVKATFNETITVPSSPLIPLEIVVLLSVGIVVGLIVIVLYDRYGWDLGVPKDR